MFLFRFRYMIRKKHTRYHLNTKSENHPNLPKTSLGFEDQNLEKPNPG
jgi:hypothetical protein